MIVVLIVLATVITIINYDRKTFIVQATGSLSPYSKTLDYAGKACQGQTLYHITSIRQLRM